MNFDPQRTQAIKVRPPEFWREHRESQFRSEDLAYLEDQIARYTYRERFWAIRGNEGKRRMCVSAINRYSVLIQDLKRLTGKGA